MQLDTGEERNNEFEDKSIISSKTEKQRGKKIKTEKKKRRYPRTVGQL